MKAILVCPEFPDTFWSFKHALKFISKKASLPPLGLLTVAAMLPRDWELKLIDMNVSPLADGDLESADIVFIGAISVQTKSAREVITRCRRAGIRIVAGGPLFTTNHGEFAEIDHFVLNEAEITLPLFLNDLMHGTPQQVYASGLRADIRGTPAPRWDLIDLRHYASMNVQYSRGCPFDCEFCDITQLFGRESRTKDKEQLLAELQELYARGWRGPVFLVDDNLIGNKAKLKQEILPAITRWMKQNRKPFVFNTQVSINLADDTELMHMMTDAGFSTVFIGIETPLKESLAECSKVQNERRDLLACVRKIQSFGLEVQGGFIIGFDNDPPAVFERQITFIQESGIVTAMVGLLNALKGTKLHRRMEEQNRLLHDGSGNNTDGSLNFLPRMDKQLLLDGYRQVISTIYAPRHYYRRVRRYLEQYQPAQNISASFQLAHLKAFFHSVILLGIAGKERVYYWKLLFWTLLNKPRLISRAITFAIYGYHYRKISDNTAKGTIRHERKEPSRFPL